MDVLRLAGSWFCIKVRMKIFFIVNQKSDVSSIASDLNVYYVTGSWFYRIIWRFLTVFAFHGVQAHNKGLLSTSFTMQFNVNPIKIQKQDFPINTPLQS